MATSNKGGLIVSSGSTSPTTQSPSAPSGGPINVGGTIMSGPAATPGPELISPADHDHGFNGIETTGNITQQSSGESAQGQGTTVEPPVTHPNTPYTGQGIDAKVPPTSGGPSQAKPKTGRS